MRLSSYDGALADLNADDTRDALLIQEPPRNPRDESITASFH